MLGPATSGKKRSGSVSGKLSILNARGKLVEKGATVMPSAVPEGDLERALAAVWHELAEIRLAAGRQRVAVAAADEISSFQSTVFEEIEIPEAK